MQVLQENKQNSPLLGALLCVAENPITSASMFRQRIRMEINAYEKWAEFQTSSES